MSDALRTRSAGLAGSIWRTRAVPLDDIRIRSGGDGRTVEAYAAVFNTPAEVRDADGHYLEQIDPAAFNRTLSQRAVSQIGVLYNHGLTLHGTPSDRASVPIGTPLEIRADTNGLLTVTRYNRTPLADEVLESIRNGDIQGQSFTGRMLRSTPIRGRMPFRSRSGELTTVTRQEIALREYGPTPFPVYDSAAIVGVRAATAGGSVLSDGDAGLLQLILAGLADGDAALDPIVAALCRTDQALDAAQAAIAALLNVPDPDPDDESGEGMADPVGDDGMLPRAAFRSRLDQLATRLRAAVPASGSGTPDTGPATASDPAADDSGHAGPRLSPEAIRARLKSKGIRK